MMSNCTICLWPLPLPPSSASPSFNPQTSLSDDELEDPSSAPTSSGGAEAVALGRNLRARGSAKGKGAAKADESDDDDDEDDDSYDDQERPQSFEKPSSVAVRAASFVAMGKALVAGSKEEAVGFDPAVVGSGGAGFEWQPNEGFDVERFTIAMPNLYVSRRCC